MDGMVVFFGLLAIFCLLSGPVALIVSIVALQRVRQVEATKPGPSETARHVPVAPKAAFPPAVTAAQVRVVQPERPVIAESAEPTTIPPPAPLQAVSPPATHVRRESEPIKIPRFSLEQKIGTRWILVAGVITVFISAGFFLKFAYEHYWIGPWGRVGIAAIAGLVCLAVGEITRRRGYEIAAKGTTALGFAILYAADFAAYRFYGLIGTVPAFATAIAVTAAAMAYAVVLDEVVAAFLAMLGGFVTPVIVSRGENLPVSLFSYVLVLSTGAMLCAYRRKWRAINLLAFAGTFFLYVGWFEKFFRAQLHAAGPPPQMAIALVWLGIFFGVYLVLPLLYGFINGVAARKDDVWLVVINASWAYYYLWTILFERHQTSLALFTAGLSAAHLVMMALAAIRCRDDRILRQTLLVIGLAFLTATIPLYWKMNAAILGWAIEGVVVVYAGIRYRSVLTQIGGGVSLALACLKLVWQLPMHAEAFRPVLNADFGAWVFVAAALWSCHFFYRRHSQSPDDSASTFGQILYAAAVLVLGWAASLEWASYCKYNLLAGYDLHLISRVQLVIFAAAVLLFAAKPICPRGQVSSVFTLMTLAAGVVFVAGALAKLHTERFLIFVNWDFAAVLLFLAAVLGVEMKYRLAAESAQGEAWAVSQALHAALLLTFLAAIAAEWYWHCVHNLAAPGFSPALIRGQIVVFAAGVPALVARPICPRGLMPKILAVGMGVVGACFAGLLYLDTHKQQFMIFLNPTFAAAIALVAALFVLVRLLYARRGEEAEGRGLVVATALLAILALWVFLSEEIYAYWYCRYQYGGGADNWRFVAGMWMSIAWGVYGFVLLGTGFWRKLGMLRYAGLAVFAALLFKVFVIDMSAVNTIYRILGFLAAGLALVGASYMYQFLKKKGFFESA